ncbi:MAG: HAMP domain-containing histidine kinase [Marinilabiliaceae bacterium]|nr:HAMP domain-containing histidine kinase [Marinilabiliaceae bacterium]
MSIFSTIITILFVLILPVLVYFWMNQIVSKKKNEMLERQITELEKKNLAKDKFFSIISHDLRAPFSSLLGFSEMLVYYSEDYDKNEIKNYSNQIYAASMKLLSLAENLLQWSKTQLGTITYNPELTDINIVSDNVINALKLSIQEKDINIDVDFERGLTAYADSNIFSIVLRNLISNAIKFTKTGGTIRIRGYQKNDNEIEVEVKDNGIGMNKDHLDKLFQIDKHVSTAGTLNESGSGLGLILCKEFVEINGGIMSIKSEPGKGTAVMFTIPKN